MLYPSDLRRQAERRPAVPASHGGVYTIEEAHSFYRKQYEHLCKFLEALASEKNDRDRRWSDEENGKCPSCKSTDVNDRIKRIQAKGRGSMSGDFIFGCGSISGSSRFDMDTNEVNKCNKCGNEWKKRERRYYGATDMFDDLMWRPSYEWRTLNEKIEKKSSGKGGWLEDKSADEIRNERITAFKKSAYEHHNHLQGYCREVLRTFLEEHSYSCNKERAKRVFSMDDESFQLWGGIVVKVEKPKVLKKSFWRKLLFWKKDA